MTKSFCFDAWNSQAFWKRCELNFHRSYNHRKKFEGWISTLEQILTNFIINFLQANDYFSLFDHWALLFNIVSYMLFEILSLSEFYCTFLIVKKKIEWYMDVKLQNSNFSIENDEKWGGLLVDIICTTIYRATSNTSKHKKMYFFTK